MNVEEVMIAWLNGRISVEEFVEAMFYAQSQTADYAKRELPSFKELIEIRNGRYCDVCKVYIADAFRCAPVVIENAAVTIDPQYGKKYCKPCALKELEKQRKAIRK